LPVDARERLAPRHTPQQNRSRIRFQALLDAAEEVIAESGVQGLAMREVARRANLPIASVYHYIPSTAGLIRALLERQFGEMNSVLENGLQAHFSMKESGISAGQVGAFIDEVAGYIFNTPSASELWAGLHAYPDLRALNVEDTQKNAALLAPVLVHFCLPKAPERAGVTALVLVEWVSATLRFAAGSPPEARAEIVETLKTLVALTLKGLAETGGDTGAGQDASAKLEPLPAPPGKKGKNGDRSVRAGKKAPPARP
jgi:AcrR family transcriptional regulator